MSTIKTDLLQNRLGTSHPAVTKADFVKAYGYVNQIPPGQSFGYTFNVASTSDDGNGLTSYNLTAPFAAVYFVPTTGAANNASNYDRAVVSNVSASKVTVASMIAAATISDSPALHFAAMGVLA